MAGWKGWLGQGAVAALSVIFAFLLGEYPDWRAHKQLHDQMYEVVFSLKSDLERGEKLDARRLFELIQDWLVTHILGEDRKYVPFTSSVNAKPVGQWKRSNGRDV